MTIIGYTGREENVTVPSMIGGYPVNTIAPEAFAGTGVTSVVLPDTIMTVEEGAFGPGQTAVYAQSGEPAAPSADPTAGPAGVRDENGNLITTDDEGNLVLVDPQGNETVLDDSQTYTRGTDESGQTVIQSTGGQLVTVTETEIAYTDAEQNRVTVSTGSGSVGVRTTVGNQSYEQVEVDSELLPTPRPTPSPTPAPVTGLASAAAIPAADAGAAPVAQPAATRTLSAAAVVSGLVLALGGLMILTVLVLVVLEKRRRRARRRRRR